MKKATKLPKRAGYLFNPKGGGAVKNKPVQMRENDDEWAVQYKEAPVQRAEAIPPIVQRRLESAFDLGEYDEAAIQGMGMDDFDEEPLQGKGLNHATVQRVVDKGLPEGTPVKILTGSKAQQETTIVREEVSRAGYRVRTVGLLDRFYGYRELDPVGQEGPLVEVVGQGDQQVANPLNALPPQQLDDVQDGVVMGPPNVVLQELDENAVQEPVVHNGQLDPIGAMDPVDGVQPYGPVNAPPPNAVNAPLVEPFPDNVPGMALWDTQRSFHNASDNLMKPFITRWRSKEKPKGLGDPLDLKEAVKHLASRKRFFSHELPQEFLPFAIAQGAVQSGYNTTRALGHDRAKHDGSKAQHKFVFTRQLPSNKVATNISQGQVGAAADAMIVFKPTMFGNPKQPALFKNFDGGFKSQTLPPHAYKGRHIVKGSDEVQKSRDPTFHANQEQGVYGSVSLRHIAIIILKTDKTTQEEQEAVKKAFIDKLRATSITTQLPPKSVRKELNGNDGAYNQWKVENHQITLYQKLQADTGRDPEDIIKVLPNTTRRHAVRGIAHQAIQ